MSSAIRVAGTPVEHYNRKYGGRGFVTLTHGAEDRDFVPGRNLHRSLSCGQVHHTELTKVPYFWEEDGTLKIQVRGEDFETSLCGSCEPNVLDLDWQDRAKCKGSEVMAWEDGFAAVCDGCPVQVECLDQGEKDNMGGMVYAGVYLSQNAKQRRATIEARRAEL